jgi:hypothetical protein
MEEINEYPKGGLEQIIEARKLAKRQDQHSASFGSRMICFTRVAWKKHLI